MTQSMLTELALRAAVNGSSRTITSETNQPEEIKTAAEQKAQLLLGGNSTISNIVSQSNIQNMAIAAAMKGLELSYSAVKAQLDHVKQKRLAFDKERQAGIATFIIPTGIEERELSTQEHVMKTFIDLVDKNDSFESYVGIRTGELADLKEAKFYSVFPFYRMSEGLGQPLASTRSIDRQRIAINLFLKSALPKAIADIDNDFQTENGFVEFFKSAFKKENYLNDFRAPRFIMMCLANLLWNLQHPVDPATGFPLGTDRAIVLCRETEQFLNTLLDPNSSSSLKEIDSTKAPILSFVRKIENHVKSLRAAYTEEQLYELDIADLTNSAHRTLRTLDKTVLELIYTHKNPITKKDEPDSNAAEELAYMVSYLNQLLINNPDLINYFLPYAETVKNTPFINTPPTTIIDLLIIYIHCTTHEKTEINKELRKDTTDNGSEFVKMLESFKEKYSSPLKEISKKELGATLLSKKSREVATLTAQRLVPFITLVVEDYRIEVDTPESYKATKKGTSQQKASTVLRAKEQVKAINKLAKMADDYYYWTISPFVELQQDTEAELDKLPKHQYRFTQITQLLDSISEIVTNYRSFLQLKSFQQFLIKCLSKIKDEFNTLQHHIEQVDRFLSKDKSMNRKMQSILGAMTKDLGASLDAFSVAAANFEHIITAPDFLEQQKQLLSAKFGLIHEQYKTLFSDDSGILDLSLSDSSPSTPPAAHTRKRRRKVHHAKVDEQSSASSHYTTDSVEYKAPQSLPKDPASITVETKKVIALRKLVCQCLDSLSYQSKCSEKGTLLNNLLNLIDNNPNFSQGQLEHAIQELIQITLTYRNTWFFQASYAESRSAKALLMALKNPELNGLLPLSSMIFTPDMDVSKASDKELIDKLKELGKAKQWKESANEIQAVASL